MRSTRSTKRTPTIIDFHIIYLILELRQDIIKRECASNWRTLFSLGSMWIILEIYILVNTLCCSRHIYLRFLPKGQGDIKEEKKEYCQM